MDYLLILLFVSSFLYILVPGGDKKSRFLSTNELHVPYLLALAYFLITFIVCKSVGLRLLSDYQRLLVFIGATTFLSMPIVFLAVKAIDYSYAMLKSNSPPILQIELAIYESGLRRGRVLIAAAMNIIKNCFKIWFYAFPLLVAFYCYSHLKCLIPLFDFTSSFDALLWRIENQLVPEFAMVKLNFLLRYHYVDTILQFAYHSLSLFYSMILGSLYFGSHFKLLGRILSALIISFFVANLLYYLVPCDGPIFYKPEAFKISQGQSIDLAQKWLRKRREVFLSNPRDYDVEIFNGIAGFPSMHIAQTLILLIAIHIAIPRLFWPAMIYEFLVIISTLAFGWHYLLDDIAGFLVAVCSFKIAMYLHAKLDDGSSLHGLRTT